MSSNLQQGPYNFNGADVYFDTSEGEFWNPSTHKYLDHELGIKLCELYFGNYKADLNLRGQHKCPIKGVHHKKTWWH